MKPKWKKIPDSKVRHKWVRECTCEGTDPIVYVDPSYYADSGTPTCGVCGEDYAYDSTEVSE